MSTTPEINTVLIFLEYDLIKPEMLYKSRGPECGMTFPTMLKTVPLSTSLS
jgi:hypothetical protein